MSDPAFDHAWVCVGRVEDLAAEGAWLRAPLTRAGVLVTKAADGELRAFQRTGDGRDEARVGLAAELDALDHHVAARKQQLA